MIKIFDIKKWSICGMILAGLFLQCYSFKGVSIDSDVKTFSVSLFANNVPAAPPTIQLTFSEKLREKVRNNTRLQMSGSEGDLTFTGSIDEYTVIAVAPQPGQSAPFNQLKIVVNVELVNSKNEKGNWKQAFGFQSNFDGSKSLLTVQEQLIKEISDKIVQDIFNKAFTENW
jgi:Lipopolysaccharide-assembly